MLRPATLVHAAAVAVALLCGPAAVAQQNVKVRDLTELDTQAVMLVRDASGQVTEYAGAAGVTMKGVGLVYGLSGTGDGKSSLTRQMVANQLAKSGFTNILAGDIDMKNVASVMLTATYPPFAREGDEIDMSVSAMNASDLSGGVLLETPLQGPGTKDGGAVYAVAQGPLSTSGAAKQTVAKVRGKITREILTRFYEEARDRDGRLTDKWFRLKLRPEHRSLRLAANIAREINDAYLFRGQVQREELAGADGTAVKVHIPSPFWNGRETEFLSFIETVQVDAEKEATVTIDERTGTIAIDAGVKVTPGSVSHGDFEIEIKDGETSLSRVRAQMKALNIPAKDQIAIIDALQRNGQIIGRVARK
ncbi:MAG: flagellar basal body P-ring protein FlgI [Planctomycetes bacterium]|nr:flagellar basal body P-ring protein FlgI [Planctomycetota bacterium]